MNKNIIKYIHTYTLNILLCSLMFFLPIHLLIFKKDSGLPKRMRMKKLPENVIIRMVALYQVG